MWPEDMPQPGTRQFTQWFSQQDPEVQNQIVFDFGLADANQPVMGNNIGGFQPEISQQGFGMLDQMAPPPVINSKGVIQPPGTEQRQKQLNLFQDENSLMTDNVLAAIAGQFAPGAFTPTYQGQGEVLQGTGLRQLQSLANTGGWEGFMASQMLPKEYGGGGMSSSQAKGALMKAIKTPDNADEAALQLREELRGSLTPRYETQGESTNPQYKPLNKDLTTDQGIVNSYDFSDVDTVSRGWQADLAKDPIAAFTDPTTGLSYAGAKEIKTPTMEWFDKYGLPYANKRYDDPDQIAGMQNAVAPLQYQGQMEAEDFARQEALDANAAARKGLDTSKLSLDMLTKAYDEATKGGITAKYMKPLDPNVPTDAERSVQNVITGNAPIDPRPFQQRALDSRDPAKYMPPKVFMNIDAEGNFMGLAGDQEAPKVAGKPETRKGMEFSTFDYGKPDENGVYKGPDISGISQLMPFLSQVMPAGRKLVDAESLAPARARVEMAKKAAARTVPGIQAASNSSETSMQRQLARARMMGLAATGRTPLSDTLAGRMMAARSAGIYG